MHSEEEHGQRGREEKSPAITAGENLEVSKSLKPQSDSTSMPNEGLDGIPEKEKKSFSLS